MSIATEGEATARTGRLRLHDSWRIVRLHAVNPSVFFGVPLIIFALAWVMTLAIALIMRGSGGDGTALEGMRYSWAVLSPQWYLVVVGVQAVGLTFPFALGFSSTRRDFWLGTSVMFVLTSIVFAVVIATLVQLEILTGGWWLGAHMFDALWYGANWVTDFYTAFALQLLVLFLGAAATTVYMRWRMRGMVIVVVALSLLLLGTIALLTFTRSWPGLVAWLGSLGAVGLFTLVLGFAAVFAIAGFLVIKRATPR